MDIFIDYLGNSFDLDDLETYDCKLLDFDIHELWLECVREAGFSLFYMQYIHPSDASQMERVEAMCKKLMVIRTDMRLLSSENRLLLLKWLYRFKAEVENQC